MTPISPGEFIPFALPSIGEEEIDEVADTLRSGWLTTGPRCEAFETQFAEYIGTSATAIAVNSATAGLHLALEASGVGPGDTVIVPTFTFTATAEVVRYLGARPVLADVDSATLNIDVDHIVRLLDEHPNTKAVMPVHFGGLACDMERINALAVSHGLSVIEDAAHALPAVANGVTVGSESEIAVFSFYATKGITTGEGGIVLARNEKQAQRVRTMSLHGIDNISYDRYRSDTPSWYYEVIAPGFKYNMTDVAAAMGIHQLRKADDFMARRTEIARRYLSAFTDLPVQLPATGGANDVHSWHLFSLRLTPESPADRDAFIAAMTRAGIGTSVHFIPLHLHPYWADFTGLEPGDLPVAANAYRNIVSLPIYPAMTDAQVERIVTTVVDILAPGATAS